MKNSSNRKIFLGRLKLITQIQLVGPGPIVLLKRNWPTVFVDGGIRHRKKNHKLLMHIGDGDSSEVEPFWLLARDKDVSDLGFVLSALPKKINKVYLTGFLGGRRDHEFCNFLEALRFCRGKRLANFDNRVYALGPGQWRFAAKGVFTVVAFKSRRVQIFGDCLYKSNSFIRSFSSHGLSNEAFGEIKLANRSSILVFFDKPAVIK